MSPRLGRLTLVVVAVAVLLVAPGCGDPAEPTERTLGGARLVGVEVAEDVRAYHGLPADRLPFNDLRGARDVVADGEGGVWLHTTVDLIHVNGDGKIDAHTTRLTPLRAVGSLSLAPDGHLVVGLEAGATWLAPLGSAAERNADVDFGQAVWSDTLGLGFRYADMAFLPDGTWLVSSLSDTHIVAASLDKTYRFVLAPAGSPEPADVRLPDHVRTSVVGLPDGRIAFATNAIDGGPGDGLVYVIESGGLRRVETSGDRPIRRISPGPGGTLLALDGHNISRLDVDTGEVDVLIDLSELGGGHLEPAASSDDDVSRARVAAAPHGDDLLFVADDRLWRLEGAFRG